MKIATDFIQVVDECIEKIADNNYAVLMVNEISELREYVVQKIPIG